MVRALDKQGRTRQARHLRQLSSVIYHGSAASELKLPIAYSDQYRKALNAIHGTDLPGWSRLQMRPPAIRAVADTLEVPFHMSAIDLMSYDVITDIRSSDRFKRYIRAMGQASQDRDGGRAAEKFQKYLAEYLDYLNEPLGSLLVGRYRAWRASSMCAQISKTISRGGAASIALYSSLDPALSTIGLAASAVWGFAGWAVTHWLDNWSETERRIAREKGFLSNDSLVTINTAKLFL